MSFPIYSDIIITTRNIIVLYVSILHSLILILIEQKLGKECREMYGNMSAHTRI